MVHALPGYWLSDCPKGQRQRSVIGHYCSVHQQNRAVFRVQQTVGCEPTEDSHFVCFCWSVSFICPQCPVLLLLGHTFLYAVTHFDGNICWYYRETRFFFPPQTTTFFASTGNFNVIIHTQIHTDFCLSTCFCRFTFIYHHKSSLSHSLIIASIAYLINRLQGHLQDVLTW